MAGARQAIGLSPIVNGKRFNQTLPLQASDGAVKGSRPQPSPAHDVYVVQHGVAVFWSLGQTGQNQERRVGKMLFRIDLRYVLDSTHDVVISQGDVMLMGIMPSMSDVRPVRTAL